MIVIKSHQEIELMREAGKIVAETLTRLEQAIRPGITTGHLDNLARKCIHSFNAQPAFLGYYGFPASICASVNEEVVHGIPGLRKLKNGDIISIDVGVYYKGYCGDSASTFPVGEVSPLTLRLVQAAEDSFYQGISFAYPGKHLQDISSAIQNCAESQEFSVVRNFVGHGIGSRMHEEPQVPNYGSSSKGVQLQEGMVLAIEPMVNEGTWEVETLNDNWTVVTKDRKLSAHYEHTVAILEGGPEILTSLQGGAKWI